MKQLANKISIILTIIVGLLAIENIIALVTHWDKSVYLFGYDTPMVFNSSLCILLTVLGFYRKIFLWPVLILILLIVEQRIFGNSLHTNTLFFNGGYAISSIAENTIVSLLLITLGILVGRWKIFSGMCSSISLAITSTVIFGYFFLDNITFLTWPNSEIGMSIKTAICLTILNIALILKLYSKSYNGGFFPEWFSYSTGVFGVGISYLFYSLVDKEITTQSILPEIMLWTGSAISIFFGITLFLFYKVWELIGEKIEATKKEIFLTKNNLEALRNFHKDSYYGT